MIWSESAQRRPEITPGYDRRATGRRSRARAALNEGRRLPPATTVASVPSARRGIPLNEGRRLPPATTRSRSAPAADHLGAQRRPEITPGYDSGGRGGRLNAPGSLNEGRRLPPATTRRVAAARLRARRGAQRRPEITPGYDVLVADEPADGPVRSTKAGDYPRLRRSNLPLRRRAETAQRRPEITPGYDWGGRGRGTDPPALNEGRRLPPATTGRICGSATRRTTTLNEGRRLPPATTSGHPTKHQLVFALNEGRRLPPATT